MSIRAIGRVMGASPAIGAHPEGTTMHYLILIYGDETQFAQMANDPGA